MSLVEIIKSRLATLAPSEIDLKDDSHRHAGHPGAAGGGGHFDLVVVSDRFTGLNALARHRMVYSLFLDLIPNTIHALSIKAFSPEEWDAKHMDLKR